MYRSNSSESDAVQKGPRQQKKRVALKHPDGSPNSSRRLIAMFSEAAKVAAAAAGALALASSLGATPAHALPQNGTVVGGNASISQANAGTLNINQTTNSAIINWQGYSIGSNELVRYLQPGSSSIVLNRVTGQDPSYIFGKLSGNGQVWVVNPNGLLVGPSAKIQTGSFLASTLGISNEDFAAGRYTLKNTASSLASIVNQGNIQVADGGYVVLAAPSVTNTGSIVAHLGRVQLASGDQVTLNFEGNDLIDLVVSDKVAADALGVKNTGIISAAGGQVLLTAKVATDLLKNVVNNEGIIQAVSIVEKNGSIILDGGSNGIVANSGTLDASGRNAGEVGGSIKVLGDKVALFEGAKLDVSGDAGGGQVLVGGNFHGFGPEQNSSATYLDRGANISADAVSTGNGGEVAVWSDGVTRYYGATSAKGGWQGGNGGFVEVSGAKALAFSGGVTTTAEHGTMGTLLLDPANIVVQSPGGSPYSADNAFAAGGASETVNPAALNEVGSSVLMQATNDITFASDLHLTSDGAGLTAQAGHDITVNAGVSTNNGKIVLSCGGVGTPAVEGATLTVAGKLDTTNDTGVGGADIELSNTQSGGIRINNVIDTNRNVTLTATAGAIVEGSTGAVISAELLTASSASGQALAGGNSVRNFNAGNTTSGDISLNNYGDLLIDASPGNFAINNSAGGVAIVTVGSISLPNSNSNQYKAAINALGDVSLTAYGGSSDITAYNNPTPSIESNNGNVTLFAGQDVILGNAGSRGDIYTWAGPGNISLEAGRNVTLNNESWLRSNKGSIHITAGNDIIIKDDVLLMSSDGGDISLKATWGAIMETGGTMVTSGLLSTQSAQDQTLRGARVGSFNGSITSSGNLQLVNRGGDLKITGVSEVAGGSVEIINEGALVLEGAINTGPGGTVKLDTLGAGKISGTGRVTADTIQLQSMVPSSGAVGSPEQPLNTAGTTLLCLGQGASLTGAFINHTGALTLQGPSLSVNSPLQVAASGQLTLPYGTIDTGSADLFLKSGALLSNPGVLYASTGNITLQGDTGILVRNTIDTSGKVTLTAAGGTIVESDAGAVVNAAVLSTESMGGQLLNGANKVGSFHGTNSGAGNIELENSTAVLAITGINQSAGADIQVRNSGNIFDAGVIATTGKVTLAATGGTLVQGEDGAVKDAATLTTSSTGGQTLNGANTVASFQATNAGGGSTKLTNSSADLTLTGIDAAEGGAIQINNTGNLSISGAVTTSGTVALTASGTITESGAGAVGNAATLSTGSTGGQTLNGANTVAGFNAGNSGGGSVELTNAAAPLTITGISQADGGNIQVVNSGDLVIAGKISTSDLVTLSAPNHTITDSSSGTISCGTLDLTAATIGFSRENPLAVSTTSITTNTTAETGGVSASFNSISTTQSLPSFHIFDETPSLVLYNNVAVGGKLFSEHGDAVQPGGTDPALFINAQQMDKMLLLTAFEDFFTRAAKGSVMVADDQLTNLPSQEILPGLFPDGTPCQLISDKVK